MKVVVIGGGIIGLSCTYYLRKQGYDVVVVEQTDLTDGCSFGNMGYISPSHFIPLATPGIIKQGIKWMMSSTSPFYIKPRLNKDLIQWGLAFKKSANASHVLKSAPHLNNLLQLSRQLMADLKSDLDAFDFVEDGIFMLYKSQATGKHEAELAKQADAFGLKTIVCSRAEVQDYEKNTEVDVAGGVLYVDDSHVNPEQLMKSLYNRLLAMGVVFYLNTQVTGFQTANGKIVSVQTNNPQIGSINSSEVIIANGSWMGLTAKQLGIRLLMQPGKGYSVSYSGVNNNLSYASILVDDRVATTPIKDWLRIGGTMELSGHSNNILQGRVQSIYKAFKKYYPAVPIDAPNAKQAWYGYRPVSPDGMPYIGRHSKFSNLIFAGGHAMLGVSAAAATGLLVNQLASHQATSIDVHAFNPNRF